MLTADASGERRQVDGRAVADVAGPFTLWVEYFDGVFWRTAADAAGTPVAVTRVAVARQAFLSRPGLAVQPLALAPGGSVSASFVLANLDEHDVSLYDLTLTATQQGGSRVETAAPILQPRLPATRRERDVERHGDPHRAGRLRAESHVSSTLRATPCRSRRRSGATRRA